MDTLQTTNNTVSWKWLIPYRIISILFTIIALATFVSSFWLPIGSWLFLYIAYVVLYVCLIIGFWKMRKWVVTLLGCTVIMAVIVSGIRLFLDEQEIIIALLAPLLAGVIFLFVYVSRSHLEGKYWDRGMLILFGTFLILSQLLLIFLNK
jgi:hypothetical protein